MQSLFGFDFGMPPLSCSDSATTQRKKDTLLATIFNSKQSVDILSLSFSCDPTFGVHSVTFMSSEVLSYLNDLDCFSGCDPLGFYLYFIRKLRQP